MQFLRNIHVRTESVCDEQLLQVLVGSGVSDGFFLSGFFAEMVQVAKCVLEEGGGSSS